MPYLYKQKKSKYWWTKISADGQSRRFSTKQKNKKAAERIAFLQEEKLRNQEFDIPARVIGKQFDQAVGEFLELGKSIWEETHFIKQRNYFKFKFIPYFKPNTNIKHLTESDILNYMETRKKEGISESTYNRELTSLKAFFKYSKQKGWIKKIPTVDIKQLKENQAPRAFYTKEECEKLLAVPHPRIHFFWIQYFTGLRPNEVLNLQWQDVDFKKNVLYVVSRKKQKTKTKRTRAIPLHPQLAEKLNSIPRPLKADYIVCTPKGTKYARYGYRDFVKRICAIAGVEHKASYSMRHTFGTLMCENSPPEGF